MSHVFISYKRDDSAFVADLIRQIEDAGFRVWSDHERLREEETGWRESIDQAIRDAFALLLVITPATRESEQMSYEWMFALGVGVPVIPVIRATAKLHPRLEELQRMDFTDESAQPWGKLLRAIREAHERGPRRGLPSRSGSSRFDEHPRPPSRPSPRQSSLRRGGDRPSPFERDRSRFGPRDAQPDDLFRPHNRTLDKAQMDKLIRALEESTDRDYRTRAAHRLGETGDRAAISPLIKALRDDDGRLREAAALALAKFKAGAAVPALIETLRRVRPSPFGGGAPSPVIMSAIRDIGTVGLPVLIDALSDDDPRIRLVVIMLLSQIGDRGAVPALTGALRDPEPRIRWKAADALGIIGDQTAVPVLTEMLADANKDVRITAAWALGQIGHQSAVEGLLKLMHDREWRTRWAAAQALWEIGAEAVPALITKLYDEDEYVRRAASRALAEIGAPAIEPLITTLGADEWDTRWGAASALQEIGDKAVPALVTALDTDNWQTTWAAAETLKRIGTPEAMKAVTQWQQARGDAPDAEANLGANANGSANATEDNPTTETIVELVDDAESDPGAE